MAPDEAARVPDAPIQLPSCFVRAKGTFGFRCLTMEGWYTFAL